MRKHKVKAKEIVNRVRTEMERQRKKHVTLSLNPKTWEAFQKACLREKLPAFQIVERLMYEFTNTIGE